MHAVAVAVADLARSVGATLRCGEEVAEIVIAKGRAAGVRLGSGERLEADSVIVNADPAAIAAGLFGRDAAAAVPLPDRAARSFSAVTWTGVAKTSGFPLHHHTVFFSRDYRAEFDALGRGAPPGEPTVYVCAQDRDDGCVTSPEGERLLVLMNAPATGDRHDMTALEIEQCATNAFSLLDRCGLRMRPQDLAATTPTGFDRLFPGTGGALYGQAVHGPTATFKRPGSRTAIPGLYLAGGATHPGAGVPMAALSGRLAASALMADLGSTPSFRARATSGGMSTRSAMTGSTRSP